MLTGSYALDALAGPERFAFERHLDRCDTCADEVRGLRETAARLALATAIAPPREMRQRVLTAAPLTRQLPPPGRNLLPGSNLLSGRNLLPRSGRRDGPRLVRPSQAGVTAAIVALAAAVVFLFVTQAATQHQLRQVQASSRAIAAVLAAPDARAESMTVSVGGTATAVMSLTRHEAVISTAGVPALPGGKVYQLWVMSPAAPRSAGLLPASRAGITVPVLAEGVRPGDRLGITVEPAGGTARPTTAPVVVMPVPA
jgi:anti-sigma-K factor RskA